MIDGDSRDDGKWLLYLHPMDISGAPNGVMLPHGDHVQDMGDLRGHKIKLLGPVSNASEDRFWHVVAQTSQTGMENGFPSFRKKPPKRKVRPLLRNPNHPQIANKN